MSGQCVFTNYNRSWAFVTAIRNRQKAERRSALVSALIFVRLYAYS